MYPNDDTGKNKKSNSGKKGSEPSELVENKDVPLKAPDVVDLSSKMDLNTLASSATGSTQNQALLDIKHQALKKLSGLIDNLEHSPEQHFQTLMMIIQETDNIDLIDKAYATALQLKDAKERAQALLTIANEINYFTSK